MRPMFYGSLRPSTDLYQLLNKEVQVQVPSTTSLWSALNSVVTEMLNYKESISKQVKKKEHAYHVLFGCNKTSLGNKPGRS